MPNPKTKPKTNEQTIITPPGIVSFCNVWAPKQFDQGDPAYSLILVFDKTTDLSALRSTIQKAVIKKFGEDYKKKGLKLRSPIRPVSEYTQYGEPFTGKSMAYFVKASSKDQPGIVDRKAQQILDKTEVYSGCTARMSVYAHPYDTKGNKGVTFLLNNVQKMADGKRLAGGRMDPEKEFDVLDDEDDDGLSDDFEDDIPF